MSNLMPAALAKLFPHADTDDLPDRPKGKRRANPERDLQRAIIKLIHRGYPRVIVWAAPNEQRGDGATDEERMRFGAARKASGVLTGAPDLTLVGPGWVEFWELKSPKGRLSPGQHAVHLRLAENGARVFVIRSLDEAAARLRVWGNSR